MRSSTGILVVLLTACGGAAPSADGSAGTSTAAEPSVATASAAEPSDDALPSASSGLARPGAGMERVPVGTFEGQPLGYVEYSPPVTGEGEPPLLVFLHGGGEAGDGSEEALHSVVKLGIPYLIAAGNQEEGGHPAWPGADTFRVLMPQYGTAAADGECAIAEDVAAFLNWAIDHYAADPARVYLTGISCGAIGIWDYLATYGGGVVAAAVPISGHAEWALEKGGCASLSKVPVWAFHGAADEIVPPIHVQGPMDAIRECEGVEPAEMELTVYPDADHLGAIDRTYDLSAGHDIYAWMLAHAEDSDE